MRYLFHLNECGDITRDETGHELSDAGAAHGYAVKEARAWMAAEVLRGKLCLSCRIIVEDETGATVDELPFREMIALTGLNATD